MEWCHPLRMARNPDKIDYSAGLPEQFEAFEILFMSVSAMLGGMNGFSEIEHFCEKQTEWLRKWIKLPNGIPRAQTFSYIFQIIDPDLFKDCLIALRQLDLSKAKGWSVSQEHEKAHGRITTRTILTTTNLAWMDREIRDRWPSATARSERAIPDGTS